MSNQGENLTVIVITFNRLDYTMRTIDSLLNTVPKAKFIIHDNDSTEEGMKTYLLNLHKSEDFDIDVGFSSINRGWGMAINEVLLLHEVKTDFVLLSNNDVEYKDGWYDKALALYEKYSQIGILGLWKHIHHGIYKDYGDLVTKDQMPATCWLLKPAIIKDIGPFAEHGPCLTKGGNGEDVDYCIRAENKGYWVAGPKEDLADHLDGYV